MMRQEGQMKIALTMIVAVITLQSPSATVTSGSLPPCEFADTESATSHPFSTLRPGSQILSFQISLLASPSNNVEVAIGRDSDEDGELSVDETALVVGWDCGEWIMRSGEFEGFFSAAPATGNANKTFSWELYETDGRTRCLVATENGNAVDFGRTGTIPSWTFSGSWNLARLVVRGADEADESFVAKFAANGTSIRLR